MVSMIKTSTELVAMAKKVAQEHKTLYVLGCFGAPMNTSNKNRYTNNLSFNKQEARKKKILAASADTFGFDCVCFVKGLLWDWVGDTSKEYGGAKYQSNGVPDINADSMIKACKDVSTDFSNILPGEAVWIEGHIGIYIGNGLAAECTHRWADGVQITAVHNIGTKSGYNGRIWTKHGKLPYISYATEKAEETTKPEATVRVELTTLRKGAKGEQVKTVQRILIALGYDLGKYGADGDFGSATDKSVRDFQKAKGLSVDGVVGTNSWNKLLKG